MKLFSTVQVGVLATLVASALASNGAEGTRPPHGDPIVELGRRLFFDPATSADGATACAACHDPDHGFSDPRRFSQDAQGPTRRHSQPTVDLPPSGGFHWDGEFLNLREPVFARVAPPQEATAQARAARGALPRLARRGPEPQRGRVPPLGERNAVVRAGAKWATTRPVDLSGGFSGPIRFGE